MTFLTPPYSCKVGDVTTILENVEHCGGEPEQAIQDTSLMGEVIHQVNHPPTCTSIYHSQVTLRVFWFTNLSWHIAGFVTKLYSQISKTPK